MRKLYQFSKTNEIMDYHEDRDFKHSIIENMAINTLSVNDPHSCSLHKLTHGALKGQKQRPKTALQETK